MSIENNDLTTNLDKLHTTELGTLRIRRNIGLETVDVVAWCRQTIENAEKIIRNGKNWYAYTDDCFVTINAHSYTIITAHKYLKQGLCDMSLIPDPNVIHPVPGFPVTYIKPTITRPNIIVGEFSYYSGEDFESRVTHHYEIYGDKLIIGKFCQIASGVEFIMNGANHKMDSVSTFPFYILQHWGMKHRPCRSSRIKATRLSAMMCGSVKTQKFFPVSTSVMERLSVSTVWSVTTWIRTQLLSVIRQDRSGNALTMSL